MANQLARRLRKNQTLAEQKLWLELRTLKERGFHFRRQVPIATFIVDFACLTQKLAIEVDGAQHFDAGAASRDSDRDARLRWLGFNVLRFSNSDVMDNCNGCLLEVLAALGAIEKQE